MCDLWEPTILAYFRAFSLLTSAVSFIAVSSLIISYVMTSSFILIMNNSYSHLSFSLFLYFVDFILNMAVHSSAVSSAFLLNLQCWSDSIVSLCHDLNLSFNILNNLSTVWYDSFSICLIVGMNRSPSLPNQFLMIDSLHQVHNQMCIVGVILVKKWTN